MSKVELNPAFEGFHGKLGDLVFRTVNDQVVVSRKGDPTGTPPTAAQLAARERFRLASQYGKLAMADAGMRLIYEAAAHERKQPVFSVAVSDYYHAPLVDAIDVDSYHGLSGDTIAVSVDDDVLVVGVTVTVALTDGTVLDSGEAVETPANSGRWVYTAPADVGTPGTDVMVTAVARDMPDNETAMTYEHQL